MDVQVLFKTWYHQDVEGYVFLAKKTYNGKLDKNEKPLGTWDDQRFRFPKDKFKITRWIKTQISRGDRIDLYWCPNIFNTTRRKNPGVVQPKVLYADLDFVNPDEIAYRPTVAWQSSPERYQCLWFLDESMEPEAFEESNKSMTYLTGADKSGWDLSQVLRIPGLDNHKTPIPTEGKMLWGKYDRIYSLSEFDFESAPAMAMELKLTGDFFELITKYKKQLEEGKIYHRVQWTSEQIKGCDRSDNLWAMTREMVKTAIPMDDIFSIIQQSAWNKYADRSVDEEKKRIINDINKCHASLNDNLKLTRKQEEIIDEVTSTPEDLAIKEAEYIMGSFKSYEQVMSSNTSRPNWLIDRIWVDKSQGIVAGEAKTFKSTLTTDIAMSVASGAPLWGKYKVNHQGPVLVVQVENNEDLVKDRMARMADSKGVCGEIDKDDDSRKLSATFGESLPIYTHIADKNHPSIKFGIESHRIAVEMMIKKIKPVLVIFDPLYMLFEGDMSSSQELAPALRWMKDLRINYDTSVMLVHHYNKGSGEKGVKTSAGHRMLGSVTLHGWVECMIALEKGPTENGVTTITMNKEFRAMGASEPLYLSIKMGEGKDDYTYQVTCRDKVDMEGREDNSELLIQTVTSYGIKGISMKDLCEALEITHNILRALITKTGGMRITGKGMTARVRMLPKVAGIKVKHK